MTISADIVVGLQYGDCGKGKVTNFLCGPGSTDLLPEVTGDYTHVVRYNGGSNAGHTIFHQTKKVVLHQIPSGVLSGIKSVIGPGCAISPTNFSNEVEQLCSIGFSRNELEDLILISENATVVSNDHLTEDNGDEKIGTTKRGIGPAYRDRYARTGILAKEVKSFRPFLVDIYKEFYTKGDVRLLLEGAQGFGLDILWGDYPYVTSSHCTSAGALLNGIPPQAVRNVIGVAKVYETYVGKKSFQPVGSMFSHIRDAGGEYGATTGRPRQCNWLNWDLLERSVQINGASIVILNKLDVLRKLNYWGVLVDSKPVMFNNEDDFTSWLYDRLYKLPMVRKVIFSDNPMTV